uniref:Nucleolar GTP-binding protein 1 (Trinotate prediction) n=1 Tax=Myxobolus squamalis TaxID=59785 RepID=A0A6B2FWI1_MYXSQ
MLPKKSSKAQAPLSVSTRIEKFKHKTKTGKKNRIPDEDLDSYIQSKSYTKGYQNKLMKSGVCKQSLLKCKGMIQRSRIRGNRLARAGDADRHIYDLKPKHLFSGKRKSGKTQRR